jgi:hypothetical protein
LARWQHRMYGNFCVLPQSGERLARAVTGITIEGAVISDAAGGVGAAAAVGGGAVGAVAAAIRRRFAAVGGGAGAAAGAGGVATL